MVNAFHLLTELYDVCELLHGEFGSMQSGLTSRSIEAKSDYLVTDLSASEAAVSRDVLVRALYGRLFTWLVNRVNEAIKVKTPRKQHSLGILDMYGFESTDFPGGFEQLVMNFATEKLQQVIIDWTLSAEQEEYASEAIEWTNVEYPNNAEIVSILERSSFGILSLLDEVCVNHQHMQLYSNVGGTGSGSSTPSLALSADEAFVERMAERFSQTECIEVGGHPSSASAATTSSTSGQEDNPDDQKHISKISDSNHGLPQYCFK